MLCLVYVVLYHAIFAGFLLYSHCHAHGFNWVQAALAVFQAINAWIAVCEIALLTYSGKIQQVHKDSEAKLGVGRLPPVFLFEDVSFGRLFTLEYWSVMWSTYCALDPSYADTTTFGFCVDIGNGVTTLVPTVLFALGMTWPLLSPRWLGMMGLIMHYQVYAPAGHTDCHRPPPTAPAVRVRPPGILRHVHLLLPVLLQRAVQALAEFTRLRDRRAGQRHLDGLPRARHVGVGAADPRRRFLRLSMSSRDDCLTLARPLASSLWRVPRMRHRAGAVHGL
jgi:hypothetical protein